MEATSPADLRSLDADVRRAVRALAAYSADLARDPEAHDARDPLASFRHVAGRTTFDALGALRPVSFEVPLRDALRRWIAELTLARVARPQEVALAKALAKVAARYTLREVREVSYREAWRGIVAAPSAVEAGAWLAAASERGPDIAAAVRERAAVRTEAASRLGLDDPAALSLPLPRARLAAAAARLLDATEDSASHVLGEARAREEGAFERDPTLAVRVAVARDAPEGWPAQLTPRWLAELFAAGSGPAGGFDVTRGLRIALPALPVAVGATSFARSLGLFGHALAVAGVAPSLPYALADDPQFVRAHSFALVFGALPASDAFQRRALGVAPGVARDQARVVARAALLSARVLAARYLLAGGPAPASPDLFEELTSRVFGVPLPRALAGAWPAPLGDEPARLTALLTSVALARELVERFDLDWFRNPRAAAHLRALASAPAREEHAELDELGVAGACAALARAFEEAIA